MRYLTLQEVLSIYFRVMEQSGGMTGVRDPGALEASVAQPPMTFAGADPYATVVEKAAALGFSIIQNHPFVDGNKRAGHASMEVFLILNRLENGADTETQASVILSVAAGQTNRQAFTAWLEQNVITRES